MSANQTSPLAECLGDCGDQIAFMITVTFLVTVLTCPPSTAPLPERDSVSVKTKGGHSIPRGKKELAEQIIPYAASVEVEVGRGKTVAESVRKIGV